MSRSQHTVMLHQVDNITAAELREYFVQELPNLTDLKRARCERYIESLAAFERRSATRRTRLVRRFSSRL